MTWNGQRQAVFLDRDGTIIEDVRYCARPEEVSLLPEAARAIALLNMAGMPVVIVTNQSGIARGYFDWAMLEAIHDTLRHALTRESGRLDAIYVCPHHPDDGCACRKPRPGLLLRAAVDLHLDLSRSYMVGDQQGDILTGHACGCTTVLVGPSAIRGDERGTGSVGPDFRAGNLYAAAQWILSHAKGLMAYQPVSPSS